VVSCTILRRQHSESHLEKSYSTFSPRFAEVLLKWFGRRLKFVRSLADFWDDIIIRFSVGMFGNDPEFRSRVLGSPVSFRNLGRPHFGTFGAKILVSELLQCPSCPWDLFFVPVAAEPAALFLGPLRD
jgi:hypothetical protein